MISIYYTRHALMRMLERKISNQDVTYCLINGEIIESYKDDSPFPSRLILSKANGRHLHIVAAYDTLSGIENIITVYEPDLAEWQPGFRIRIDS